MLNVNTSAQSNTFELHQIDGLLQMNGKTMLISHDQQGNTMQASGQRLKSEQPIWSCLSYWKASVDSKSSPITRLMMGENRRQASRSHACMVAIAKACEDILVHLHD